MMGRDRSSLAHGACFLRKYMMKKLFVISVLAVSVSLAPVTAKDLLVDPKKPGAYATLQAAMNAASPGDRILVKGPLMGAQADVVIDKSVTIESVDSSMQTLILFEQGWPHDHRIFIKSLTMGKPLTLRRLHIDLVPMGSTTDLGIRSDPSLFGDVRMEDVDVTLSGPRNITKFPGTLVDLTMDGWVWMRRCRILAPDTESNFAAQNWLDRSGSDALVVRAMSLVMEDCKVRAGSAGFGRFTASMQDPAGGDGGRALRAATSWTLLVRSSFSDGNGGFLETGAWQTTPKPGKARPSQFTRGYLGAYDSTHEHGRNGAIVKSYTPNRGASGQLGDFEAPLTVGGSAVLGKRIEIEIASSSRKPGGLLFGFEWWLTRFPPYGDIWMNPLKTFFSVPVSSTGKLSFGVPNNSALIDLPVIAQVVTTSGASIKLGNPSGIAVRK